MSRFQFWFGVMHQSFCNWKSETAKKLFLAILAKHVPVFGNAVYHDDEYARYVSAGTSKYRE